MNVPKLSVTLETALVGFFIVAMGAAGTWLATFAAADPRLALAIGVATGFLAALAGSATGSYVREVQAGRAVTFAEFGGWMEQAAAQFALHLVSAMPQQPQASVTVTTPTTESGTSAPNITATATVGDASALPPVTSDPTVDASMPATPDTQESGSTAVVAAAEVVPEAVPVQPTRMVLIDGTPYVPAGGVL